MPKASSQPSSAHRFTSATANISLAFPCGNLKVSGLITACNYLCKSTFHRVTFATNQLQRCTRGSGLPRPLCSSMRRESPGAAARLSAEPARLCRPPPGVREAQGAGLPGRASAGYSQAPQPRQQGVRGKGGKALPAPRERGRRAGGAPAAGFPWRSPAEREQERPRGAGTD